MTMESVVINYLQLYVIFSVSIRRDGKELVFPLCELWDNEKTNKQASKQKFLRQTV